MRLSKTQAAYIAGVIDGDGYIGLSKKRTLDQRSGYSYRPVVSVSNTKVELLFWLEQITGVGSICAMKRSNLAHKQAFIWQTWSQRAADILRLILPYLILKKKQAELMVSYTEKHGGSNRKGINGLTRAQHTDQARFHARMAKLNKRGTGK